MMNAMWRSFTAPLATAALLTGGIVSQASSEGSPTRAQALAFARSVNLRQRDFAPMRAITIGHEELLGVSEARKALSLCAKGPGIAAGSVIVRSPLFRIVANGTGFGAVVYVLRDAAIASGEMSVARAWVASHQPGELNRRA